MTTLSEAITTYLKRNRSEYTIANYESTLRGLADAIGKHIDIRHVRYETLLDWEAYRRKALLPSSLATYISQIQTFFRWCVDVGYIDSDPSMRLEKPSVQRANDDELSMPQEDLKRLIEVAELVSTRDYALLCFMASTACRVNAASGLTLSKLYLDDYRAKVVEKGNQIVWVYFDDITANALRQWLEKRPAVTHDYVFTAKRAPHDRLEQEGIRNMMHKLCAKAGIDEGWTPHSLRHGLAQFWSDDAAIGLHDLKDKLNHKDFKSTLRYRKNNSTRVGEFSRNKSPLKPSPPAGGTESPVSYLRIVK